jgi:hypothetical protein
VRCLSCKYDLSKLTEHRCPECGRVFDPADDRSIDTFEPSIKENAKTVALIVLVFAALGVCAIAYVVISFAWTMKNLP